jgi:pilus assembly protein CpaB
MKPKTMVLLLVAIMCGLAAAYLTAALSGPRAAPTDVDYVYVPKAVIKPGVPLTKPDELFDRMPFPKDKVQKEWITDLKSFTDQRTSRELKPGLPVTKADLGDQQPSLQLLKPGQRAISIGVSNTNGAGGWILPGNRVDVVVTIPNAKGGRLSKTFLSNILVLAINDQSDRPAEKNHLPPGVATLALTPEQAERVIWVSGGATISLMLRHPDDTAPFKGVGASSPWAKGENPDETNTPPGGTAMTFVKVPVAKKDVEVGDIINAENFDTYFDEIDIPDALAGKALLKTPLIAAQKRFYNKLLVGNWPTERNLTEVVKAKPFNTHTIIGKNGGVTTVSVYNKDTELRLTTPVGGPETAPNPGDGK